ncbi:NAD-dependent epimerase/dehydratase family protein [Candidatus Thiothrix sp. Deng01]|uniref:NAD-dependent epimerase/dehydratase family protein n=1 Tax=Candidatus Thiothrix phosphatis TaxID=3112415 RepID=A0ABU6CUD3_9GAMM|nr:NAD-dependent epimerase/dehydratase family protein [Candidatus Thiothrix sp. Deng01]MEB4590442.1 NAD-dependent epimerase/dehydratase family protein [Candidatus Thiothrix sp. Deng01]
MKILLTGANGFIGGHIRQALEQAGHEITPVSRHYGFDFQRMLTPDDWLPHLQGVDVAINSVGIIAETRGQTFATLHHHAPAALFRACVMAGVMRVVQISALGADEQAFTPYHLSKKAADDVVRSLPLEWFVLRPSLVYGEGGKSSTLFRCMASLPIIPLVGDGKQRIQPVQARDVVATVLQCLQAASARRTLDVVGAYPLTFVEWLQSMRRAAGKKPALTLPIPFGLIMASAHIGRFAAPMLHPDNLRMLQRGNTADVQPLAKFLGRMPLGVGDAP